MSGLPALWSPTPGGARLAVLRGPPRAGAGDAGCLQAEQEIMGVGGGRQRLPEGDHAVSDQREQALVEGLHALVFATGDLLLDAVAGCPRVDDARRDPPGDHHGLHRGDTPAAVGGGYEALVKAGVPAEAHIFPNGAHGSGLGKGDPSLDQWPSLLETWLRTQGLLTKAGNRE